MQTQFDAPEPRLDPWNDDVRENEITGKLYQLRPAMDPYTAADAVLVTAAQMSQWQTFEMALAHYEVQGHAGELDKARLVPVLDELHRKLAASGHHLLSLMVIGAVRRLDR